MLRHLTHALGIAALPTLADDDILRVAAEGDVATVTHRPEAAVTNAGANVFARIDHGSGAASVDIDFGAAELLIFGNPKLGTPALQADILAGLYLPLRGRIYADAEGQR